MADAQLPTAPPNTTAPSIPSFHAPRTPHSTMAETNGTGSAPMPDLSGAAPSQVRPGGAPARIYLNQRIVPHLLEGLKSVARDQPANPLRVLGEFLIQKGDELESETNGNH
ncbi:hypothetical protein PENDEC_c019G05069 [Penicillium decumbens]|uniref:COMPASS complex subunit Sdc1 n=1 Tax=Penicillium decumbens TaxID=69771 RepID=A0A1V6P7M0_PENDC|nr:hypothetical protein PENDEC_c019G05069 [Penicillium decumbens]